jgi:cytochrome c oxidase subunit 1
MAGLADDKREVLLTTTAEALPQVRWSLPDPDAWPLWGALALSALFIGSIFNQWAVVWFSIPVAITLTAWFWPRASQKSLAP